MLTTRSRLHFDWIRFVEAGSENPPTCPPRVVRLCLRRILPDPFSRPRIFLRVWWEGAHGLEMYVGDRPTGPARVYENLFDELVRVADFAADRGLAVVWSEDPPEVEELEVS